MRNRKLTPRARRYVLPLFVLAWVNFAVHFGISHQIGGSSMNGKVTQGSYYVGDHGKMTEVSRSVYNSSLIHEISVIITHALGLGLVFLYFVKGWLYEPEPEMLSVENVTPPIEEEEIPTELGLPRYPK